MKAERMLLAAARAESKGAEAKVRQSLEAMAATPSAARAGLPVFGPPEMGDLTTNPTTVLMK